MPLNRSLLFAPGNVAKGAAAIQVDGQVIAYPVVHRAQALLDAMKK